MENTTAAINVHPADAEAIEEYALELSEDRGISLSRAYAALAEDVIDAAVALEIKPEIVRAFLAQPGRRRSRATVENIETALDYLIEQNAEVLKDAGLPEIVSCRSFAEAGLLGTDKGLVLRFADGREFQLAIARSK